MEFQLQNWVHHIKIDVNLSKLENEYEDGDLILEKPLEIEELATFSPKIIIKDLQTRAVVGGPLTRNFAFHMEHVRYIIIKEDQLQFTEVSLSGEKICLRRLQSAPRKLDRSSPPKLNNRYYHPCFSTFIFFVCCKVILTKNATFYLLDG